MKNKETINIVVEGISKQMEETAKASEIINKNNFKTCLSGYEIHSFDKKGKIYVKEKFVFTDKILCNNVYVDIFGKEGYAIIYDKDETGQRIELAKVHLEIGDIIVVKTENYN